MANKTSNNQQQKETGDNGQRKNWKSIVIMNSKSKTARVITLEVLVQEQKLKLKRERKDIMYIQNMLRRRTPILRTKMYNHYAIGLLKQE